MMLHRRMPRGRVTHQGSMSRAQFFTAVQTYNNVRQPANRLVKQPLVAPQSAKPRSKQAVVTSDGKIRYLDMTSERPALSDEYSYYENTSRHQRQPNDVRFPPVFGPPAKSAESPKRPVKQGSGKLPNVSRSEGCRMSWYHADGAINLQALNQLTHRQSFPGASHHGLSSGARAENGRSLPVQFLDDGDLTPRMRAERDSFLSTLTATENLTDEEINDIADHFYLEEVPPDEEAAASSLSHPQRRSSKSKSPQSARSNSTKSTSEGEESAVTDRKPKSVHFFQSTSPRSEDNGQSPKGTPRPYSSPDNIPRQPSDPFHVARSNANSPDEEVAYLTTFYPPPEMSVFPASSIPEPEVHYYDDEGEEVDEDIASQLDSARERESESQDEAESNSSQSTEAGGNGSHEAKNTLNGRPTADSAQRKWNSQRPHSSTPDSDTPEKLDTPRVIKESASDVPPKSPRSETSPEEPPRPKGLSDSSDTDEVKTNTREGTTSQSGAFKPLGESSKEKSEKSDGKKREQDGKRATKQQAAKEDRPQTQHTESPKVTGPVNCTIHPSPAPVAEQTSSEDDSKNKKQRRSRSRSKCSPSAEPNKGVDAAEDKDKTDAKKDDKNRKRKHKSKHVENDSTAQTNENIPADDTPNGNSKTTVDKAAKENSEDSKQAQPSSHPNYEDTEAKDKDEDKENNEEEEEEEEDLPPIPVISLTRGQLGVVPARPPKHEAVESQQAASGRQNANNNNSRTKQSDLENGQKEDNGGKDGKRRRRSKDERMKIWLTRRAWGRPVDCVDID